ncbi:MAG: NAD-binding oxidoreductase, partial [Proteobacteria bacterium]|nr:NAD-binding oxidoreductase [Pseudomonadota bacterium]
MRLFSNRSRPVHLGAFPLERLSRRADLPDMARVPRMRALSFDPADPLSLSHAMARFMAMFDLVRDGPVQAAPAEIPDDPAERSRHLKAAASYFDVSMAAVCALSRDALLPVPIRNPMVTALGEELERSQPKSFAAGMDMILADVLDSARQQHGPIAHHGHALVLLVPYTREPRPDEPGCDWLHGTQAQRAALLAAQTAVLLSTYLRLLGHEARAHSATCSDVDLNALAVASGLVLPDLSNPFVGTRYGLAAVSTTLPLAADAPLAEPGAAERWRSHGPAWWLGWGGTKSALDHEPHAGRDYRLG